MGMVDILVIEKRKEKKKRGEEKRKRKKQDRIDLEIQRLKNVRVGVVDLSLFSNAVGFMIQSINN